MFSLARAKLIVGRANNLKTPTQTPACKTWKTMSKISHDFLEVKCSTEYLQSSKTRNFVVWTKAQINRMHALVGQYPFLSH